MISSLGSDLGFWSLKRAKRQKEGRILQERLLLVRRGAFGVWRWGLMHEDCMEEELALCDGQQGVSFFYYFLESFQLGGGRTTFSDCFLSSLSSSHQN
jgi:hypothetical protein